MIYGSENEQYPRPRCGGAGAVLVWGRALTQPQPLPCRCGAGWGWWWAVAWGRLVLYVATAVPLAFLPGHDHPGHLSISVLVAPCNRWVFSCRVP